MTTLLVPTPAMIRGALAEDWPSGVVVATDGRDGADAAIVAASRLAGSSDFGVISVIAERSSRDRESPWGDATPTNLAHQLLVEDQLRRLLGDTSNCWIEVRRGYPPAVIASFGELNRASLLVVGIGRPRVLDRLHGDESTLRLARMARTPLYAVAPCRATPPRRVVVGIDFAASSLRAIELARCVAAPDAELILAHVTAPDSRHVPGGALQRHASALQTGFCGRVRTVELNGDPATELLAFANAQSADAIALGRVGDHPIAVGALGAIATRVVRCASCSLLLASAA